MSDKANTQDQAANCCPDGCDCSKCCDDGQCDCAGVMSKMMGTCCKPSAGAEQGDTATSGKGCC